MRGSMMNEGRPQREIEQTMSNVGQGGGIKMPSLGGMMGGGKSSSGGGGGKSGGGMSAQPLAAPPPAAAPVDTGPGYELPPVITAPKVPMPTMKPQSQNMSLPPVQGPNQPYFKNVDSAESEMWNSGPGPYVDSDSPGGIPYEPKTSPTWDRGRKRFTPPIRPR